MYREDAPAPERRPSVGSVLGSLVMKLVRATLAIMLGFTIIFVIVFGGGPWLLVAALFYYISRLANGSHHAHPSGPSHDEYSHIKGKLPSGF